MQRLDHYCALRLTGAARRAQVKWRKGDEGAKAEEEERVVSIISSLLGSLGGSRRDRVAAKFVEAEFEKCDRLVELYTRYDARVRAEEVRANPTRVYVPMPSIILLPGSSAHIIIFVTF